MAVRSISIAVLTAALTASSAATAAPKHAIAKPIPAIKAPTGTVSGQAFIQTSAGSPRTCAGQDEVVMVPVAPNFASIQSTFGSSTKGFVADVIYPVAGIAGVRSAVCDATGTFKFLGVEPGSYFLISHIAWANGNYGGSVMKQVEVAADQSAETILSASVDDTPAPPPVPPRDPREVIAEQAVRARLIDPTSAEFQWSGRWVENADYKAWRWSKPIHGDYTCGKVNSRNRMGGYAGQTDFLIVVSGGAVAALDMDEAGTSGISISSMRCQKLGF